MPITSQCPDDFLLAVDDAAALLADAASAFLGATDDVRDRFLRSAKSAESALIAAMRRAGVGAVRVGPDLFVDVYAHHVADADGEGLWDVAIVPVSALAVRS